MNVLDFSGRALVMAIINCNDDSFYAPSRAQKEGAVEKALQAVKDGADIIDFGAESTRPGASYIKSEEEQERLIPVISEFRRLCSVPISVDTRKASVALCALEHGADIINDISSLEDDPDMSALCAKSGSYIILMHKKGVPLTMQDSPLYGNLHEEVLGGLNKAVSYAIEKGIAANRIIIDPGIGFGKKTEDNLSLLAGLSKLCDTGYPVLVGLSRKSFIGEVTGRAVEERLAATIAANTVALIAGAKIIRVHDVSAAFDTVKMVQSIKARSFN